MARKKRLRRAELETMPNVVDARRCGSAWFEHTAVRREPIVLELGCGRGEYTIALARTRPDRCVLGVDRNGARLWKGAARALDERLANAFFLHSPIEHLEDHVPPGRVGEIWLPFPDPLPKNRQARHRLVSAGFLARYRRLLCPGGAIHLKSDDRDLVTFAEHAVRSVGGRVLETLESLTGAGIGMTEVQTTYERRYRDEGRTIYNRTFCLE